MTVLVVEDDSIILEGLVISLRQEGYDVLEAGTQEQALSLLKNGVEFHIKIQK